MSESDLTGFIKSAVSNLPNIIAGMQEMGADTIKELRAEQITSKLEFQRDVQEEFVNPQGAALAKKLKDLETRTAKLPKAKETQAEKRAIDPIEHLKDLAGQFQKRNPELKAASLIRIRNLIKPGQSREEMLKIVQDHYPDVSLADEVLDFLLEDLEFQLEDTDSPQHEELKETYQTLKDAQDQLRSENQREIAAGRNISKIVQTASTWDIGSPSNLRNMYRDFTQNPRDTLTLFQELSQKYSYRDLLKVSAFLFHALGKDMNSKGPSIARGELHTLLNETRSLQAIFGVYKFFRGRMKLTKEMFAKDSVAMPPQVNFENLTKQFINLASNRYLNSDKVLQSSSLLGIEKSIPAKITVFQQFRDAVKQVSIDKVYNGTQHRDEVLAAIVEALEILEEQYIEEQERQYEAG